MVSLQASCVALVFFVLLNVSIPYGRFIFNLTRDGPEGEWKIGCFLTVWRQKGVCRFSLVAHLSISCGNGEELMQQGM